MNFQAVIIALVTMYICIFPRSIPAEEGYMPPGNVACGGVSNMALIFAGGKDRVKWTEENLLPYAAYLDKDGKVKDSFFDAFLFLETKSKTGGLFYPWPLSYGKLANKNDWDEIISQLFKKDENLDALNNAVKSLNKTTGSSQKAKVVLFIPYPDFRQPNFGDVDKDGVPENFGKTDDRLKAVRWYIDMVMFRWKESKFANLELTGFYWLSESISDFRKELVFSNDPELVKLASEHVHKSGYRLFWIPWHKALGMTDWKDFGIDCAFLQPNYFFKEVEKDMIRKTAETAKSYRMGIEIEFDKRVCQAGEFAERYKAYLDGGVDYGYMKNAVTAYYEGGGALLDMYSSKDANVREFYDMTYRFAKGIYSKKNDGAQDK